jgi:hypothetical protein
MPGVGKMLSMAGARASSAFAGGGEFLAAANRGEPLAVAVRAGTSSVATGGDTFLVAVGGEPLAVAVRAGTSSVADGGVARTTGGGYIGTSGAVGGVGRGDKMPGLTALVFSQGSPGARC